MSKELTEEWAIITPEKCQEINTMISGYKKTIERLQEQLKEANELIKIATPLFSFGSEKVDAELSNFKRYLIRWSVK